VSSILRFPASRLEQETAANWLAKIDRGLRDGELAELRLWLAENPNHRVTLLEAARLWDRMDMLSDLAELFPLQEETLYSGWKAASLVAVVIFLGLLTGMFVLRLHKGQNAAPAAPVAAAAPATQIAPTNGYTAVYSTGLGEQSTVTLPDHSTIKLNTNTLLEVEFTANARLLRMEHGEANFKVAKDPSRVFTVRVLGFDFNAVGTAFNIRTDLLQGVKLTVTEGKVRVQPAPAPEIKSQSGTTSPPLTDEFSGREVEANREMVIGQSSEKIQSLPPSQLAAETAWQRGMMVFDATPLAQVVAELSRYSTTRFVLTDPDLGRLPVSGYFKLGDVDALSAALEQSFGITVKKSDNIVYLSARTAK
jgi:transmembrane sensor